MTVGSLLLEMFKLIDPFIFSVIIAALALAGALLLPARMNITSEVDAYPSGRKKLVYVVGLVSLLIGGIFTVPIIQKDIDTGTLYLFNTGAFLGIGLMLVVENYRRTSVSVPGYGPQEYGMAEASGAPYPGYYQADVQPISRVIQAELAESDHGASAISYGHTPHPDDHMPRPKPIVRAAPTVVVAEEEEKIPVDYLACPHCGATFPIFTANRPLKIECPSCGVKGVIR